MFRCFQIRVEIDHCRLRLPKDFCPFSIMFFLISTRKKGLLEITPLPILSNFISTVITQLPTMTNHQLSLSHDDQSSVFLQLAAIDMI